MLWRLSFGYQISERPFLCQVLLLASEQSCSVRDTKQVVALRSDVLAFI